MPARPPSTRPDPGILPEDLPADPLESYNPGASAILSGEPAGGASHPEASHVTHWMRVASEAARSAARALRDEAPEPGQAPLELRRLIAEGGFGEVWEAIQHSLGRTVAVKRLKAATAPDARATPHNAGILELCFRQEALVTARLEHPNIVPVYDLGADSQGRPLIAMKLVRGRPWIDLIRADWAAHTPADFLARHLPTLISVAQATAFAHSRGIVHRDLKPGQVMLGRYGEVYLMDWGLAMHWRGRRGEDTQDGSWTASVEQLLSAPLNPAGTPSFMAPEQTTKDADGLGPWTDIYLLGGILYHLLTLRYPHHAATSKIAFRLAQEGHVRPPADALPEREIPPQLAALAMRAMAREPADRVATAEDFVDALQDYLSGSGKRREASQLVVAVKARLASEALGYEGLSEALNSLERSLALWPDNAEARGLRDEALARYARAALRESDLKLARLHAERLPPGEEREALVAMISAEEEAARAGEARLAEAYRAAEEGLARAKEARQRAERSRAQAERLVRFLLGDLSEALKPINRLDLLLKVAEHCVQYFDEREGDEQGQDEEKLLSLAVAHGVIGDVLREQARTDDARAAYERAFELARQLASSAEPDPEWRLELASAHDRLGQVDYFQGRSQEALAHHREALAIRRAIHAPGHPDARRLRLGMAHSLHRIGIVEWRQRALDASRAVHQEALGIYNELAGQGDESAEVTAGLAWIHSTLANVYRDMGRIEEAIAVTKKAMAAREELVRREPGNAIRLEELIWTKGNFAYLLLRKGDLEGSLAMFREDLSIRRRLSAEDPTNAVRLQSITFPLGIITDILRVQGRLDEALAIGREALGILERLRSLDDSAVRDKGAVALQRAKVGEVLVAMGRWDEAGPLGQGAEEAGREAVGRSSANTFLVKALARALVLQSLLLERARDIEGRDRNAREVLSLLAAHDDGSDDLEILQCTATARVLLGDREAARPALAKLAAKRWLSPWLARWTADRGA